LHASTINFEGLAKRVFDADKMTIGGVAITPEMRELYKEQARYLLSSNLWEVFNATIINEAGTIALKTSADWSHIEFAKAIDYWHTVLAKMLLKLSK